MNLDSARQSQIEASKARVLTEEDHSPIGKADEEDPFGTAAASQNSHNLSGRSITPKEVKRILISNWSSLGDVLLSTSVIPIIKTHFPNCKIGFLVSKHSKIVLETCCGIDWIHETECWLSDQSMFKTFYNFFRFTFREKRRLSREIAEKKYECALEMYAFFPNTISVSFSARIPMRIGFNTAGNSNLLTEALPWPSKKEYLPNCYWSLLEKMGIKKNFQPLEPVAKLHGSEKSMILTPVERPGNAWPIRIDEGLPKRAGEEMRSQQESKGRFCTSWSCATGSLKPFFSKPLAPSIQLTRPYLVFHPCSSTVSKDTPLDFWKKLYELCIQSKISVYFTGKGERDRQLIHAIAGDRTNNLCNKLTWKELIYTIKESSGIVTVDSVPVHIAAALETPFAVLYQTYSKIWHPDALNSAAFGIDSPIHVEDVFNVASQWVKKGK